MRKAFKTLSVFFILAISLISCVDDFEVKNRPFVVAFSEEFKPYGKLTEEPVAIKLIFSKLTTSEGMITIRIENKNVVYNEDYKTIPEVKNNEIQIPIKHNTKEAEFVFKNLKFPHDRDDKTVSFEIVNIDYPDEISIQGYFKTLVSFDASYGGVISPEVGGPNQAYQVYVGLRDVETKKVKRDSWDLAFYSGDKNRVKINGSIYMATKALDETDIDKVRKDQVLSFMDKVFVGPGNPENVKYVDDPSGDLNKTAIAEISENDSENKVYMVNLGAEPGTSVPSSGVNVTGEARGWKKIRILKRANGYLLQYADLDDSSHEEKLITKDEAYNFQFFSFNTNEEVLVEPTKENWDLNFTVFTNVTDVADGGVYAYGFSDCVINNIYGNVQAYRIEISGDDPQQIAKEFEETYRNLKVDTTKFSSDQRVIGASWRSVFSGTKIFPNIYVIKDSEGNHYKLKFLSMLNDKGQRGYPKFEYKLIK